MFIWGSRVAGTGQTRETNSNKMAPTEGDEFKVEFYFDSNRKYFIFPPMLRLWPVLPDSAQGRVALKDTGNICSVLILLWENLPSSILYLGTRVCLSYFWKKMVNNAANMLSCAQWPTQWHTAHLSFPFQPQALPGTQFSVTFFSTYRNASQPQVKMKRKRKERKLHTKAQDKE